MSSMGSDRKRAILAGVFFIVAAFPAMAALGLYQPVLHDSRYIVEASRDDTQVLIGAFLEVLVAISVAGTAVVLFPILRRHGEGSATGYLVGRLLESALIVVGIISLVAIVTLRQGAAGAPASDSASLITTGKALVALHNGTFLFGPGFAIGINTTLLASLVYRSQLVPRTIARIGLIGGPAIFASSIAVLFGAYQQTSTIATLAAIPVFAWEMSLAGWLIAKGFKSRQSVDRPSRPIDLDPRVATVPSY